MELYSKNLQSNLQEDNVAKKIIGVFGPLAP
jgi:hypothetical protein